MSFLTDSNKDVNGLESPEMAREKAAKTLVSKMTELAVLPHVVFKVLEISGSTDSAASEMEQAITIDPGFSAKVLTYANSSHLALSRKVTSIRDAIVYLGFKAVRETAMTVGVFDMFVGKNDKESLRRRAWWRHSVDTGVSCRYIAELTKKLDPAEAYTCGLLHYIGKTLLDRFGAEDYEVVEKRVAVGSSDLEAELRTYGCTHEDVADAAGKQWGLPASVVESFRYTVPQPREGGTVRYSSCVALGSAMANMYLQGSGDCEKLPEWALEELEIERSEAHALFERTVEKIAAAAQAS
jgi:HD-like signal output (HDOD) protein